LKTCKVLGDVATSWQQVVVMEFGKRHDTTDTTDFCLRQLVTDLLRGNWCNGFWPNTPPRTSTSHLASDPKCRPPSAQPRTQLSMATCAGQRTMEATRGNGYAPVWGSLVMMMMMMHHVQVSNFLHHVVDCKAAVLSIGDSFAMTTLRTLKSTRIR